jgi:hypothetical protein
MSAPASATSFVSERLIANDRSRPYVNGPEERGRGEVADRRVGERLEAVVEDVLRAGDIQRPEEHRREQHEIDDGQAAHSSKVPSDD